MQPGANGSADEAADSRWMTYAELATARCITTPSAIKLVLRRGWRRQKDNHGIMRALVPPEWCEPARRNGYQDDAYAREAISVLETSVAALRERAEAAEQIARMERERADRAVQTRDAEHMRANTLRDRIDALRAELAEALEAVEVARHEAWEATRVVEAMREADSAWRTLGRIERVRRAWRGE
ncbi:MAG TPA: hypothetical protein VH855_23695 [Acetobacteraceae bacterium]